MLNKAETKEFNPTQKASDACQKRIDEIDPAEDLKIKKKKKPNEF